jgi:hypothetical protein
MRKVACIAFFNYIFNIFFDLFKFCPMFSKKHLAAISSKTAFMIKLSSCISIMKIYFSFFSSPFFLPPHLPLHENELEVNQGRMTQNLFKYDSGIQKRKKPKTNQF